MANSVKFLINHGADLELKDTKGCTALTWAAKKGKFDICKMLLDAGANTNVQDNEGETPLMISVKKKQPEIVILMLTHFSDVSLEDDEGHTAMDIADSTGDETVIDLLKQKDQIIQEYEEKKKKHQQTKSNENSATVKSDNGGNKKVEPSKFTLSEPDLKSAESQPLSKHNTPAPGSNSSCCLLI